MSSELGIFIMMNNYLHDVATAFLVTGAVTLLAITRKYDAAEPSPASARFFLAVYGVLVKLVRFSLAWIIIGGIPRVIYYQEFEWANAAGKNQVPALIGKHMLAFFLVGCGLVLWKQMQGKVRAIRETAGTGHHG